MIAANPEHYREQVVAAVTNAIIDATPYHSRAVIFPLRLGDAYRELRLTEIAELEHSKSKNQAR